jgi:hypothetical protein
MRRRFEEGLGKRPGARGVKTHALVASLHFDKPVTRFQAMILARRAIERGEIALEATEPWHPKLLKVRSWSLRAPEEALHLKKPPTKTERRRRARSKERKRISAAIAAAKAPPPPTELEAAMTATAVYLLFMERFRRNSAHGKNIRIIFDELRRRMKVAGPLTEASISGRPPPLRDTSDPIPAGKERNADNVKTGRSATGNHARTALARKDRPDDRIPPIRGRYP